MLQTKYNSIPLIVLPCSADKLSHPAKAVDFYLGKGYLPVLKNKINLRMGRDYDLAFMSAKYGLVLADEVLSPYDLKMTVKQAAWLVDNKSERAINKLKKLNPSKIIACLPKLYLSTFERMVAGLESGINLIKPTKSSGIGLQRQFLSMELDKLTNGVASFFSFYDLDSKNETVTTIIEIRTGDVFTPYLGGVGENKKIGTPVKIKQIIVNNDSPIIIDETNDKYSLFDVSNGLSLKQREAAAVYGGFYVHGMDLTRITTLLSQINVDIADSDQKIA